MAYRPTPQYPPLPSALAADNQIRASLPVRGEGQTQDLAKMINWLRFSGSTLVTCPGALKVIASNAEQDWHFYLWPGPNNENRIWNVTLVANVQQTLWGEIDLDDVAQIPWKISASTPVLQPVVFSFQQRVSSPSAGPIKLSVNHDAASGGGGAGVFVTSINCFELPAQPSTALDWRTFGAGQSISDRSGHGISELLVQQALALIRARRACLVSWASPLGSTTSSGTFQERTYATVLARRTRTDEATRTVQWAVRAQAVGGNGEIRLEANSGDSHTETVNTLGWYTGELDIECDDPSRWTIDGGLPSGVHDEVHVDARVTTGSIVELYGFSMGEDA